VLSASSGWAGKIITTTEPIVVGVAVAVACAVSGREFGQGVFRDSPTSKQPEINVIRVRGSGTEGIGTHYICGLISRKWRREALVVARRLINGHGNAHDVAHALTITASFASPDYTCCSRGKQKANDKHGYQELDNGEAAAVHLFADHEHWLVEDSDTNITRILWSVSHWGANWCISGSTFEASIDHVAAIEMPIDKALWRGSA
jgi:hypothetical protein